MNCRELSLREYEILAKLYVSDFHKSKNATSISEFEKYCGYSVGNPTTRRFFKYLYQNTKVLIITKQSVFGTKVFYLDKKVMGTIIHEQPIFKLSHDCYLEEIF